MKTEPLEIETECGCENPKKHCCVVFDLDEKIDPLTVAVFATKNGAQCCTKEDPGRYIFFIRIDKKRTKQRCYDEIDLRNMLQLCFRK